MKTRELLTFFAGLLLIGACSRADEPLSPQSQEAIQENAATGTRSVDRAIQIATNWLAHNASKDAVRSTETRTVKQEHRTGCRV